MEPLVFLDFLSQQTKRKNIDKTAIKMGRVRGEEERSKNRWRGGENIESVKCCVRIWHWSSYEDRMRRKSEKASKEKDEKKKEF